MTTLRLDFHPRANRAASWGGWAALAVAVACALAVGRALVLRQDALASLRARHDLLEARQAVRPTRAETLGPEQVRQVASANQVIDELAVPWDAMLAGVESADARGLGVLSLVPDARQRSVRVGAQARSVPDMLAYVDRLAAIDALEDVHLDGYDTVASGGVDVVAFTVAATWRLQ